MNYGKSAEFWEAHGTRQPDELQLQSAAKDAFDEHPGPKTNNPCVDKSIVCYMNAEDLAYVKLCDRKINAMIFGDPLPANARFYKRPDDSPWREELIAGGVQLLVAHEPDETFVKPTVAFYAAPSILIKKTT